MAENILKINDLTVSFGSKRVIDNISFSLEKGRVAALVGESGSGKTLTSLSILGLLPEEASIENGEIIFKERNILGLNKEEIRKVRGKGISMVFQEPFTFLNPVMRIGTQLSEAVTSHESHSNSAIKDKVAELLNMVKLPQETAFSYPHELSGGMRQRIMMAMALASNPEILILDEPTTALDVSIQKHILDLVKEIQQKKNISILFITHDFSIVNMIADSVWVMKNGCIVESGEKDRVLKYPQHIYTKELISCIPILGDTRERLPELNSEQ